MTYSLMLNTSVIDGTPSPIQNITSIATGWRRWIDWVGGADIGEFKIYGDPQKLLNYFESWIRLDLTEEQGGLVTWNGEIRKMDLVHGNMPKSIDYNECFNRVRCSYGTGGSYCAWRSNTASQNRYGIRELTLNKSCNTITVAENETDLFLERYSWPPLISARDMRQGDDPPHLRVYAMGYKYSIGDLDCRNVSVDSGDTISVAIGATVDDAPYVTKKSVDTNSNTIVDDNAKQNAWEFLSQLIQMTDSSGSLFRGWIDSQRYFRYKKMDLTPTYYVREGQVYTDTGTSMKVHPRWLEPGIYRDMDSVLVGAARGGMLNDRNDFLVERICVDADGNLGFSSGDAYDFMVILRTNESEASGGGGGSQPSKWRWKYMTDEQKAWWLGGKVGPAPG